MKKIPMAEVRKILKAQRRPGWQGKMVYLMHICWFTRETGYSIINDVDLEQENSDCDHALVREDLGWRQPGSVVALVLAPTNQSD